MNFLGDRLKSLIGANGGESKKNEAEGDETPSAEPIDESKDIQSKGEPAVPMANDKGKMLLGALTKGTVSSKQTDKKDVPGKDPVRETQQKLSEEAPPSKVSAAVTGKEKSGTKKETKGSGGDAAKVAEKVDTAAIITPDGRKSYALKQLRYIGMSVFNDLTEFDCPEKVQELVSAYMSSEDKTRARRNRLRPIPMAWASYDPKKMRLGAHEKQQQPQQSGGERGQQQQQQQKNDGSTWSRGESGGPVHLSRAEQQRLQFEKERAEILAEREKAKMSNPEAFVDGIRKDASYHEESDAIMADLMAEEQRQQQAQSQPQTGRADAKNGPSSSSSSRSLAGVDNRETAPVDAEMDAYLRERLGQSSSSLLGSLDSQGAGGGAGLPESAGFDLGLKLSALSNLDSPDRGGAAVSGDGELGFFGDLGGLGDLGDLGSLEGGGDGVGGLGSLLGGLGDLGLEDRDANDGLLGGALEESPAENDGDAIKKEAEEGSQRAEQGAYEAQLRMQPSAPAPAPAPAAATPSRQGDGSAPASPSPAAAAALAAMTPEEKAHRDIVIRETLHSMGVASTLYQTQLGELAVHYRHQMAHNQGNVDPRLIEQINLLKHNLHQLSAHYVQFTNLVNSGAPLPQSPMRTAPPSQPQPQGQPSPVPVQPLAMSPPPGEQMPPQSHHQPPSPPPQQPQQPQQQPPAQPTGQSVSVSALFDAAKKAEAAGATATNSTAPQGTRKVNVLSMFAAAAAAEKAKDKEEAGDTSTSDSAVSTSSNNSNSGGGGGFAFHSSGTTNKKKGSAMSAASKMKLLQMKKKK